MYSRPRPLPFPPPRTTSSFRSRQILTHQNQLNEKILLQLLDSLQKKLLERRGEQTALVVHGGVISVLTHKCRAVTTDVDFIERVLPEEVKFPTKKPGVSLIGMLKNITRAFRRKHDTRKILKECIAEVAAEFNSRYSNPLIVLEHDWMNSAADVALPWHLDTDCNMVDPLVNSAVADVGRDGQIVYDSPGLRLLSITSPWIFALKLQRYTHMDEDDIVCLLQKDGACVHYSESDFVAMMEQRLRADCQVMDYEHFPPRAMEEWRARMRDCARKARYLVAAQSQAP